MGNRQLTPIDANLNHPLRMRDRSTRSIRVHWRSFAVDLNRYDFLMRIGICRKEAKKSRFFLRLIDTAGTGQAEREQQALIQEAQELTNIFGAIVRKSE